MLLVVNIDRPGRNVNQAPQNCVKPSGEEAQTARITIEERVALSHKHNTEKRSATQDSAPARMANAHSPQPDGEAKSHGNQATHARKTTPPHTPWAGHRLLL